MALNRSQYENMTKEELIQELTDLNSSFVNDINAKLTDFLEKFDELTLKYDKVYSKMQQRKSFNSHLLLRIIQLERNAVANSQYSRREIIELSLVSAGIHDDVLEASVCKALSLTGANIVPEDMHACHRMKRSGRVMIRFKCRKEKQSVMYKRKNLHEKLNLHENQHLAYKSRLSGRYIRPGFSTTL